MFTLFQNIETDQLDEEIKKVHSRLADLPPESQEYNDICDQLKKLYSFKEITSKNKVSPDTLAAIAANLLGILIVTNHERLHIIASRAFSSIFKLR